MAKGGLFRLDRRGEERLQPRVYAYYFKQWEDFRMPLHWHESTEIMYVLSGTCRVELETESIPLKKGEFIVVGHAVPHRLLVDRPCRMLNVEFGFVPGTDEGSFLSELASGEPAVVSLLSAEPSHLLLKDPDDVFQALKSLVLELDSRGKQENAMVKILLAQLLIRIARLREEKENSGAMPEERYVRRSLEYLRQNYDRDIRVRDVASAVNLHPGYLQRIFKLKTGRTLVETLTSIRMEKAKMLLKQTKIPVTDIYDYVGVGSRQYFHAMFKKYAGMTPVEYRESPDGDLWHFDGSYFS